MQFGATKVCSVLDWTGTLFKSGCQEWGKESVLGVGVNKEKSAQKYILYNKKELRKTV
jgi:hypothetical protein